MSKRKLNLRRLLLVLLVTFSSIILPFLIGCIIYKEYETGWFTYWVMGLGILVVLLIALVVLMFLLERLKDGLVLLYNYITKGDKDE